MAHDVLVVFEQQFRGQLRQVEQPGGEGMMEMVDLVFVHPFALVLQEFGQFLEAFGVEQGQQPLVENQFVGEGHLGTGVIAADGGHQTLPLSLSLIG